MATRQEVTVAVLGCGTVGTSVVQLLKATASDLQARIGVPIRVVGIAVQDLSRDRPGIDPALLTDNAVDLATSGADIVVEVMGGIEPARSLVVAAMEAGSSVVTANKALLAHDGAALYAAAHRSEVDLYFEASVAGAIPLLRPLRESLVGDRISKVMGIVNGTTNYMLTKMDEQGVDYESVLAEADALGYLEADPTLDIDGHDAAAKAAIIAELAFHSRVTLEDVHVEGISRVTASDMAAARQMGFTIKLLAIAEKITPATHGSDEGIIVRVHPAMVPRTHPLAAVRESFNAVFVEAEAAGEMMFYGRGAGGNPTASAIIGDLVGAARIRVNGGRGPGESTYAQLPVLPIDRAQTEYYINLDVADRPGVLASVASAFADFGVSIRTVQQEGHGDDAALVIRTYRASDEALRATVEALGTLEAVRSVVGVMRVEGEA